MDDTGEVPCQPIYLMDDPHSMPTLAFALGRMRQLVSNESKTIQQAADAVAGELVSDCTRKGKVAKSCRAVSRHLLSELQKKNAFRRKLKKLPSGKKRGDALREGKVTMLEPMDLRADSGGVSNSLGRASGIKAPARKAFLTSLKRTSGIKDRSPLMDEFLKDSSSFMSTRSKLGMPLPADEVQCVNFVAICMLLVVLLAAVFLSFVHQTPTRAMNFTPA
jgi:hypothetical protein